MHKSLWAQFFKDEFTSMLLLLNICSCTSYTEVWWGTFLCVGLQVSCDSSWLPGYVLAVFMRKFSEVACHCLLPKAEREYLAQDHPDGFILKVELELSVSSILPWLLNYNTKLALDEILTGAKKSTSHGSFSLPGKFWGPSVMTWEFTLSLAKATKSYRTFFPLKGNKNRDVV